MSKHARTYVCVLYVCTRELCVLAIFCVNVFTLYKQLLSLYSQIVAARYVLWVQILQAHVLKWFLLSFEFFFA